jgi:hypothetical protein
MLVLAHIMGLPVEEFAPFATAMAGGVLLPLASIMYGVVVARSRKFDE